MVSRSSPLFQYHPLIEDAAAFEDALYRPLPRFIWTNPLRIAARDLAETLSADGYRLEALCWHPGAFRIVSEPRPLGGHWAYQAGLFHIQEASSMVPVRILAPRPGMRILDLCAAPGNKTAQAAVAMGNRGTVVANDLRYHRMPSVRMHVDRLGLVNVSTTCHDGGSYPRLAGLFDAVLVDAPCSCEGTSRKRPDIFDRPVPGRDRLLARQRALLERAVRLCRIGGRIVYSTCTYDPEENEAVIDDLVRSMPNRLRIRDARIDGLVHSPGICRWQQRRYLPELSRTLRIWPHQNDTGGFFVALLERTGESFSEPPPPAPALADFADRDAMPGGLQLYADRAGVLALLSERYGIDPEALRGLSMISRNRRRLFAACSDHRPPAAPEPTAGLPLLHLAMKTPKVTTAGAAFLGSCARKNVVDTGAVQRDRYLARQPFALNGAEAAADCEPGHVLIRHRGHVLGVGDRAKTCKTIFSFYPKRFSVVPEEE